MSKLWRGLTASLIAVVVLLGANITPAAAWCDPGRNNTEFVTDNYLLHHAQSGIRFEMIRGNVAAPTTLYVEGGDHSFIYLQMWDRNSQGMARVGWRVNGTNSYSRYYYVRGGDGAILLNYTDSVIYDRAQVDASQLKIDLDYSFWGTLEMVHLYHFSNIGPLNQPIWYSGDAFTATNSQWVFRTRNLGSQFFGHVSNSWKYAIEGAYYQSNVGSAPQSLSLAKNHYNAWADTFTSPAYNAYSYDEYC